MASHDVESVIYLTFYHVIEGLDVVRKIEKTPTARGDKPLQDVVVVASGELPLVQPVAAAAVVEEVAPPAAVEAVVEPPAEM
jgi:phosphoketolase